MLNVVHDEADPNEASGSVLDEIVREAARQMLAVALQAEVSAYIDAHAEEVDENGHRLVVRNGHHNEREVITAAGPVPVRAPRVNDKRTDPATGERKRFASAILPAWARKSPRVAEVLPLLYLHGLSSSDFGPALTQFLGTSHGLSAATITRLTKDWQHRPGGGPSTHPTSSRWSVPARYSRMASSSNDPTNQRVVISKSRDTPILSPIALPARRRRACRLRGTRFRSR